MTAIMLGHAAVRTHTCQTDSVELCRFIFLVLSVHLPGQEWLYLTMVSLSIRAFRRITIRTLWRQSPPEMEFLQTQNLERIFLVRMSVLCGSPLQGTMRNVVVL